MITEKGTIKVTNRIDEKMQKEMMHSLYVGAIVMLVIGSVGLLAYFCLTVYWTVYHLPNIELLDLMLIFVLLFVWGICFLIVVNRSVAKVRGVDKVCVYEFYNGYFTITQIVNGENIGNFKVYNAQITKSKETKNYLFFFIANNSVFPVAKEGLTQTELNTLRHVFRLPASGETVNLSENIHTEQPFENNPTVQDPFEDFDK